MSSSFELWNRLVHLVAPTAAEIQGVAGRALRSFHAGPIQHNAALTDNLFVDYYLQDHMSENPRVQAIWIIFFDIFDFPVLVSPASLPATQLFGAPVPCSAQAFLDHLRKDFPEARLTLSTEQDQYTIAVGAAKLEFRVIGGGVTAPEESRLAAVNFFYSVGTTNPNRYEFGGAA